MSSAQGESTAAERPDPNAHVREYLQHYIDFPHSPHFGVLIVGPWGIGKTHLLRAFLRTSMNDRKVAYVSLFGMTCKEDIEEGLFAALYPFTATKTARVAGGVAKALLKHIKYEVDFDKAEFLNKFAADLYVFDDLERCEMSVNTALGYINEFVEHDGCKVIIVANVDEITKRADGEEFNRRREKIIGKTLEVRSAFDEAYSYFCSKIDDGPTQRFLTDNMSEAAALYEQSGLQNLRILQQTMWDFERVFACLDDHQRDQQTGLLVLLRLFFALSFEMKAGRIAAQDLHDRIRGVTTGILNERQPTAFRLANDRYSSVQLYETILNDDVLQDLLVAGVVDPVAIRRSLNQSAWFSTGEQIAWRVVWEAYQRSDAEVEAAIATMQEQFEEHKFTQAGEILHVVGLQLHLADLGISGLNRKETVEHAKRYIDEVRRLGVLQLPQEAWQDDLRAGSYGGLGFTQVNTEEMQEVWAYLAVARAGAAGDSHPAKAAALLEEMSIDADLFVRRITQSDSEDSLYPREPLLASTEPSTFVAAVLALTPIAQRTVLQGLVWRYESARLLHELANERSWVERIHSELLAAAEASSVLSRERITNNVRWTLGKVLDTYKDSGQPPHGDHE